jgi:SpoVK/Ycf46/Vps4 family AAA+-type ATPase
VRYIVVLGAKVDAICARRSTGCETASHTERKAELIAQMNGAKEDNIRVLFVGATNLPWNLDPAFLRRFEIKLYIPLPNHKARERMLEIELGEFSTKYTAVALLRDITWKRSSCGLKTWPVSAEIFQLNLSIIFRLY